MKLLVPALVAVLMLGPAGPALAQDEVGEIASEAPAPAGRGTSPIDDAVAFAANNTLFVLYHEVGHLLVHQFRLPVLGREEDAADNIATWTLLSQDTELSRMALADAARGWLLSGLAYGAVLDTSDYSAAHSLDRQRAYQIVCMMVGSDPGSFAAIAEAYDMSFERQDACLYEYLTIDRSFSDLFATSNKKVVSGGVDIIYDAASKDLHFAARSFRESGVFEAVADHLVRTYPITRPIRFVARQCDEPNAFYIAASTEIILCYELMADMMDLYWAFKDSTDIPGGAGRYSF